MFRVRPSHVAHRSRKGRNSEARGDCRGIARAKHHPEQRRGHGGSCRKLSAFANCDVLAAGNDSVAEVSQQARSARPSCVTKSRSCHLDRAFGSVMVFLQGVISRESSNPCPDCTRNSSQTKQSCAAARACVLCTLLQYYDVSRKGAPRCAHLYHLKPETSRQAMVGLPASLPDARQPCAEPCSRAKSRLCPHSVNSRTICSHPATRNC